MPQGQSLATPSDLSRWETIFLALTAALASTVLLKIASVQYLEILYLLQLALILAAFAARGYRVTWFIPFLTLAVSWTIFLVAALALALASLRLPFYIPPTLILLKHPLYITAAREVELIANVAIMLFLAHRFRLDAQRARFTMRIFFWVGVLSALWSLLAYPLDRLGLSRDAYYISSHRFDGFYNEGGPYGLYLLGVILVGIALSRLGWEFPSRIRLSFIVLFPVLLFTYSKAAAVALVLLLCINILFAASLARRLLVLGSGAILLIVLFATLPLAEGLRTYRRASINYERLSHQHTGDPNFIYGRVAGAFIAPRMLAAHPYLGVGWGNYGILRNAPEYRGAAAWADDSDDPGLGFAGYAPELGLPLFFFTLLCLVLPFAWLRRIRAPSYLQNLALIQPIVHVCGAQFNLTYPWLVTCFALGIAASQLRERKLQPPASPAAIS